MSKRKKKNSDKVKHSDYLNLITAILQLITSLILLYQATK